MGRKTSGEIKGQTAEQVWPPVADFCNLHQWLRPTLDTCYLVEGVPGQPGVIRWSRSTARMVAALGAPWQLAFMA
ncbi:hypothetical protein L3X38_007506 [Prunus dulcis]|uniref:Uncharacterized protein n=1 Tax=Prunus dulcis TaxID=3755 RepID=A0AAD4ZUU4_PRUDU|nr:hypothetical protein L3X38_007506 [Prunus dulcis]